MEVGCAVRLYVCVIVCVCVCVCVCTLVWFVLNFVPFDSGVVSTIVASLASLSVLSRPRLLICSMTQHDTRSWC